MELYHAPVVRVHRGSPVGYKFLKIQQLRLHYDTFFIAGLYISTIHYDMLQNCFQHYVYLQKV